MDDKLKNGMNELNIKKDELNNIINDKNQLIEMKNI